MTITATDFFAGAGGSSTGLAAAGIRVELAANHWPVSVATHEKNHPDTEHLCDNLRATNLRALPATHILWASPSCQHHAPSGRRTKRNAEKTHCKHGHELAGENLSIYTYRGTKHSGVLSPVRFGRPRRCGDGPMMRGCTAMRWCVAVRGCVPRQYEAVGQ